MKNPTKVPLSQLFLIPALVVLSAFLLSQVETVHSMGLYSERFLLPRTIDSEGNITLRQIDTKKPEYSTILHPPPLYDEIIEDGFPVQTIHQAGTYHSGPAINALVADITGDGYKEIVVSGITTGPIYAFDHEGQYVPGWPVYTPNYGVGYSAFFGDKTFTGTHGGDVVAISSDGSLAWQNLAYDNVATPPSVGYVQTLSEYGLFLGEQDFQLHGYYTSDGTVLPGWPYWDYDIYNMDTPANADIDGDGLTEVISVSTATSAGINVKAIHEDGSLDWTLSFDNGEVDNFPAIGDVDGDGDQEVIIISTTDSYPWADIVNVVDKDGNVERSWELPTDTSYGLAPALADLDGDEIPEIITLTQGAGTDLYASATDGYGNTLPGWPVLIDPHERPFNSAPVVGDVDFDPEPEIIFTTHDWYTTVPSHSYIHILNPDGTYVDGFPMDVPMIDWGGVPAIADIDRDCHNEIVIVGDFWDGNPGDYDKLWVFDLDKHDRNVHNGIEWGQLGGNAMHTGVYSPEPGLCW